MTKKEADTSHTTLLITGGTGYIGSHAVVAFEQAGYHTIILDNLSNSSIDVLNNIEKLLGHKPVFYEGDMRDPQILQKIFTDHEVRGVIHFAGLKAVSESCEQAGRYFDNNISGTITLCNEMIAHGVSNIIFSSSCTVYGDPQYVPVDEAHPLGETSNPYGRTKQLLEKILQDYATFSAMNVINLRYFNPIGAHPSGWLGEVPQGKPNNLMPYLFQVLRRI